MNRFRHFFKDEGGASSLEYVLIAILVAVAVVVGVEKLGPRILSSFEDPPAPAAPHMIEPSAPQGQISPSP